MVRIGQHHHEPTEQPSTPLPPPPHPSHRTRRGAAKHGGRDPARTPRTPPHGHPTNPAAPLTPLVRPTVARRHRNPPAAATATASSTKPRTIHPGRFPIQPPKARRGPAGPAADPTGPVRFRPRTAAACASARSRRRPPDRSRSATTARRRPWR